ncbi:cyclic GMP-AMP synthase DncV-like nucleotidyltransferase [Lactococcus lactis]|uniref:cyclic GMP-AMP synthase DncV-like nucleotidyltransferase n=1 Tax=Lactococcus lactis TaxID=1358 RepID=UPI0005130A90|nr:hypothetical protein [Lactococcus lactis]KGF77122.1 hypothetical protein Llab_0845 [Lactococcus lactis]
MEKLQANFIQFHDAIRLEMDDKSILIEKRKEVEEAITTGVSEFKVDFFNQGSYSTFTGVLPFEDGDYDIDRGAIANFSREDMSPKKAKEILYNALIKTFGSNSVKVKQPCVTVSFPENGVHVDVALYCSEDSNVFLARGKLGSAEENTSWEEADPKTLTKSINEAMNNVEDRNQFRRIIRYLKRWKDINFKNQENRPTGIGISVFAVKYFTPNKKIDNLSWSTQYDDANALKDFVSVMIANFRSVFDRDKEEYYPRLEVTLPVKPWADVYCKVSNVQMKDFHDKLIILNEALENAINSSDLHEATKILNKQFGDEFQIVSQEETAKQFKRRAIISDHPSA